MKSKTLIIIGIIILIVTPFAVNFMLKINSDKMANGIYYAVDFEEYPDAYAVVKGETIQFYNIDLNAIYREEQLNRVYQVHNNENLSFQIEVTEEELLEMSDLNNIFVNNPYQYDLGNGWKEGTFVFYYPCISDRYWFGLHLLYDSWNKTIKINNSQLQITFKKK
ncbi:MAG: hypothetical protein HDT13_11035 [Butyrivibrio sp.]|nr:hypothetical protein [Butyrivibrio sp.]